MLAAPRWACQYGTVILQCCRHPPASPRVAIAAGRLTVYCHAHASGAEGVGPSHSPQCNAGPRARCAHPRMLIRCVQYSVAGIPSQGTGKPSLLQQRAMGANCDLHVRWPQLLQPPSNPANTRQQAQTTFIVISRSAFARTVPGNLKKSYCQIGIVENPPIW
jgi:hypothetical protein